MEMERLLRRDIISDKGSTFGRIENSIMSLNAEVEAMAEINSDDSDELAAKQREEELEAELAKLKDKMRSEKS